MWESAALADFQGRWEEWKTCSWFFHSFHGPSFPQLVAFALRRFCGPIALFRGPPEPIRLRAGLQNVGAIGDAVQQGLLIGGDLPGGLNRSNLMIGLRAMDMTNPQTLPGIKYNMDGNSDAFLLEGSDISQWSVKEQAWLQQDIEVAEAGRVALLGTKEVGAARLVFARSASLDQNMGQLLAAACQVLGGRGGGRPELAQGGGPAAAKLEAALDLAAEKLRG